jgi:hypothetical protein
MAKIEKESEKKPNENYRNDGGMLREKSTQANRRERECVSEREKQEEEELEEKSFRTQMRMGAMKFHLIVLDFS